MALRSAGSTRLPALLALLALGLICWLAFFLGLDIPGPIDKTESLQMEVARRMAASGDWITPMWNGSPYFDKPVLPYWLGALGFRWFGVVPWAARLPAALTATATVVMVTGLLLALAGPEETGRRRWGRALFGGAILALSPGWLGWGRTAVHDIYLAASICLALSGFLLAYRRQLGGGPAWAAPLGAGAVAVGMGLGLLAKGPLGVGLPLLTILAFLACRRRLGLLRRHAGVCLATLLGTLLIALTWYGPVSLVNGSAFLDHFFGFSNLDRLHSVVDRHSGPWYFYVPVVVVLLFPWSLYLPVGLASVLRRRPDSGRGTTGLEDLRLLAGLWFAVVFLLFSLATTKLPGYVLPLVPAATILVVLALLPPGDAPRAAPGLAVTGWLNLLVLAGLAVAAATAPRWLRFDPAFPGLTDAMGRVVGSLGLPLALLAGLALLLRLGGWRRAAGRFGAGRFGGPAILAPVLLADLLGMGLIVATAASRGSLAYRQELQEPVARAARQAARLARPGEPLHVVGTKHYSVVFHGGRAVFFSNPLEKGKDGSRRLETRGAPTVLVLGSRRDLRRFLEGEIPWQELAREGELRILRVGPAQQDEDPDRSGR